MFSVFSPSDDLSGELFRKRQVFAADYVSEPIDGNSFLLVAVIFPPLVERSMMCPLEVNATHEALLERVPFYQERLRELGYPHPLPMVVLPMYRMVRFPTAQQCFREDIQSAADRVNLYTMPPVVDSGVHRSHGPQVVFSQASGMQTADGTAFIFIRGVVPSAAAARALMESVREAEVHLPANTPAPSLDLYTHPMGYMADFPYDHEKSPDRLRDRHTRVGRQARDKRLRALRERAMRHEAMAARLKADRALADLREQQWASATEEEKLRRRMVHLRELIEREGEEGGADEVLSVWTRHAKWEVRQMERQLGDRPADEDDPEPEATEVQRTRAERVPQKAEMDAQKVAVPKVLERVVTGGRRYGRKVPQRPTAAARVKRDREEKRVARKLGIPLHQPPNAHPPAGRETLLATRKRISKQVPQVLQRDALDVPTGDGVHALPPASSAQSEPTEAVSGP